MDLNEAWAELGLNGEGPHDEAAVRRAYLKGVKVRKPETDPDGFRRLREAYELARRFTASDEDGDSVPPPAAAPPGSPAFPLDGPEAIPVSSAAAEPLQAFRRRLADMPAQPWQARLNVARDAFEKFPDSDWAGELVVAQIRDSQARTEDVVAELRQGAARQDRASRWALLMVYPKYAPPEELARVRREGTLTERLAAIEAYLEQNQGEAAVDTMVEVLATDEHKAGHLLHTAVLLTLALHRRGLVAVTGRAFAATKAYMGTARPQLGAAGAETATLYLICEELDGLPDLPLSFRQDVARGLMEGDLGAAAYTVRAFEITNGRWAARRWRRRLQKRAPNLASTLNWQPEREEGTGWGGSWHWAWVVIVVLGWLGRGLASCGSSRPVSGPAQQVVIDDSATSVGGNWRPPAVCQNLPVLDLRQFDSQYLYRSLAKACPRMRLLSEYIRRPDCHGSRAMAEELTHLVGQMHPTVTAHIEAAARIVEARCPR